MSTDTSNLSFEARRRSLNLDADFAVRLHTIWTIAEPILEDLSQEFWTCVLSRPEVENCYDDVSAQQRLDGLCAYTKRKMIPDIDQDWIDFVALQGIGAAERRIEVHVLGAFATT